MQGAKYEDALIKQQEKNIHAAIHTNLFLRLVEMFHNIVHRISHALLYFRDTYFYKGNQFSKSLQP